MAQLKRNAQAVWRGNGREGKGEITTQSATLNAVPYSFVARFGDGKGTNPEELIGAAHSGCFSMALAVSLSAAGFTPDEIKTKAVVAMDGDASGWKISTIDLSVEAKVPGISDAKFQELAADAKLHCPVSKVLNADIRLSATLL